MGLKVLGEAIGPLPNAARRVTRPDALDVGHLGASGLFTYRDPSFAAQSVRL